MKIDKLRALNLKDYTILILAFVQVFVVVFFIPFHMDEFVMFHWLACLEDSQQFSTFRENCKSYPMDLLGHEYFQSYIFIGVTSSLISLPFFLIAPSVWTNYLIGVIFLFLISFGLYKSFNLQKKDLYVVLLFFPLVFSVIHDGGPVRLSMLTIVWTPFLFKQYLVSKSKFGLVWLLGISLLCLFSTEDKPFFVFLFPGLVFLVIASLLMNFDREFLRTKKVKIYCAGVFSILPSFIFLLVVQVDGNPYFDYLRAASTSPVADLFSGGPNSALLNAVNLSLAKSFAFYFIWPYFAHRTMELVSVSIGPFDLQIPGSESFLQSLASILYALSMIAILVLTGVLAKNFLNNNKKPSDQQKTIKYTLLVAMFCLWLIPALAGGWTSHHFIFFVVAWLLVVINVVRRTDFLIFFVSFISICSIFSILLTPIDIKSSREINVVYEKALEVSDENSVISCSSWGCYYQYSVLNRKNLPVVFVTPEVPEHFEKLETTALQLQKNLLVICSECDETKIQLLFPKLQVQQINTQTKDWFLFKAH